MERDDLTFHEFIGSQSIQRDAYAGTVVTDFADDAAFGHHRDIRFIRLFDMENEHPLLFGHFPVPVLPHERFARRRLIRCERERGAAAVGEMIDLRALEYDFAADIQGQNILQLVAGALRDAADFLHDILVVRVDGGDESARVAFRFIPLDARIIVEHRLVRFYRRVYLFFPFFAVGIADFIRRPLANDHGKQFLVNHTASRSVPINGFAQFFAGAEPRIAFYHVENEFFEHHRHMGAARRLRMHREDVAGIAHTRRIIEESRPAIVNIARRTHTFLTAGEIFRLRPVIEVPGARELNDGAFPAEHIRFFMMIFHRADKVRTEIVAHEARIVEETVFFENLQRIRREIPIRRAIGDRLGHAQTRERGKGKLHDMTFVFRRLIRRIGMNVAVAADFMAFRLDASANFRERIRRVAGDEPSRFDAVFFEQIENTRRADFGTEFTAAHVRGREQIERTVPNRLGVEIESECYGDFLSFRQLNFSCFLHDEPSFGMK